MARGALALPADEDHPLGYTPLHYAAIWNQPVLLPGAAEEG